MHYITEFRAVASKKADKMIQNVTRTTNQSARLCMIKILWLFIEAVLFGQIDLRLNIYLTEISWSMACSFTILQTLI